MLSRFPAWLEFPLPTPGSVIVLMSGDGLQVKVPAVLLLSFSQLVRNILTDHLPPAFSPIAISLPAVLGKTLQLVGLLCSGREVFVGGDRKEDVKAAFQMLNVSCELENGSGGEQVSEVKVKKQDFCEEAAEAAVHAKNEIAVKWEKEDTNRDDDLDEKGHKYKVGDDVKIWMRQIGKTKKVCQKLKTMKSFNEARTRPLKTIKVGKSMRRLR